jgi:hypothetical protein
MFSFPQQVVEMERTQENRALHEHQAQRIACKKKLTCENININTL